MNEQQIAVVDAIQTAFEKLINDGLRRTAVVGATDDEIESFAAEQGFTQVPVSVRTVLRLIGAQPGMWWAGTHFGVYEVVGGHKQGAIAALDTVKHELRDPEGSLVLASRQGYAYFVIDGADLHLDDPPVWDVVEHEYALPGWTGVSTWFTATAPNIDCIRDDAEYFAEIGEVHQWRDYIDLDRPGS